MKTRPMAVSVVALAIVVSACGTTSDPASNPDEASERGNTRADILDGVRAEEQLMASCMADSGFDYVPRPPEDTAIFTEDRPGYGMAQSLLDAVRGVETIPPDPNLEAVPASDQGAFIEARTVCRDEAMDQLAQLQDSVRSSYDRLDAAWVEFQASSEYVAAVRQWSACMADRGYEFTDPAEPDSSIVDALLELAPAGDIEGVTEDEVLSLQVQEIALYDADQACRDIHLAPLERDFKVDLFTRYADDVTAIRQATRGESG